ncbi:MAG TPA: heme-binding protein [Hyphomicrobiaceae bacterium]|nr:heme-binding protein [Hyphomicrobiaceae bacterium]
MKLETAQKILTAALAKARASNFMPMAIVILDARGVLKAMAAEDGISLKRPEIATGKAFGAISMGLGSRALFKRVQEQPYFIAAATHAVGGKMIPVPGGVLIKDKDGTLLGVIGISGDNSDNDEIAAVAGIEAAGLIAETG